MRVTIDASPMLVRSAGVKNYTFHWLRHLRGAARVGEEIAAFPLLGGITILDHERSPYGRLPTLARLGVVYSANVLGSLLLDAAIGASDIFHTNLVHAKPSRARLTATVYDLTSWILPELHMNKIVRRDMQFGEHVFKQADGLIAISENTRRDTIERLGIAPEKIRMIHCGIAEEYFDAKPTPRARPYVLYVGTIEPRKNVATLLDAWKDLKTSLREEFDLVIAGSEGWHSSATMARVREESTYLGYVSEPEMPGLFAGATAFVYPSLYEGFGFPVAQAMAAGVPVVTSNTSCLPEVAGESAVLVDPRSVAEITAGLTTLLESTDERRRRAAEGRKYADRYRWERCAEESLRFFREVAGR